MNTPIEIIVPIHNAADDLARLLASLLGRVDPQSRLWLVDDASTDPAIARQLDHFALSPPCVVERMHNPRNLGFVGTVNRAIAQSTGDVVLLNSDTQVSRGWLDALRRCARRDDRIATITPWSNNAEICSLPQWLAPNPVHKQPDAVATALAPLGDAALVDLPTGVGFCLWMRRAALDQLGSFDHATFGRGYGEENDWCQRALRFGWRHVLCADAYVVHRGNASFSATGEGPGGVNLQRLLARYPHYAADIDAFIQADPLRALRDQAVQLGADFWPT